MDESWRMRMGISGTNSAPRRAMKKTPPETSELEPEDFNDVYGGPPRSVLARKHSADFTNAEWFYRDMFRHSEMSSEPENLSGRRLPEFVIPLRRRESEGWTGRSNWSKCKGECMSKSKSTSSSGWSFEDVEFNPYLPVGEQDREDVALSSFTSKLRPINVPGKWSSTSTTTTKNKQKQELPPFGSCTKGPYNNKDNHYGNYDSNDQYMLKSFNYGFPQITSSLETLNVGPTTTLGLSAMDEYDDMQHLESPSSAVSSSSRPRTIGFNSDHEVIHMNSWTPEVKVINSEAIHDIDEAIAWAKEKFQG